MRPYRSEHTCDVVMQGRGEERAQPVVCGKFIVINPGDEIAPGMLECAIAGECDISPWLHAVRNSNGRAGREGFDDRLPGKRDIVIRHHHRKREGVFCNLALNIFQQPEQELRTAVGANTNRNMYEACGDMHIARDK